MRSGSSADGSPKYAHRRRRPVVSRTCTSGEELLLSDAPPDTKNGISQHVQSGHDAALGSNSPHASAVDGCVPPPASQSAATSSSGEPRRRPARLPHWRARCALLNPNSAVENFSFQLFESSNTDFRRRTIERRVSAVRQPRRAPSSSNSPSEGGSRWPRTRDRLLSCQ
jgi:hypothetical protein